MTPKTPSAHTITIEAYEAEDFIKEVSEDGMMLFTCILTNPIQACTTTVVHDAPLTSVLPDSIPETERQALATRLPEEYHKYHNIFTGTAASYLPPHCMYNIKFDIEEGHQVLRGPIYPMSEVELAALCEFIDEFLSKGFIRPSTSPTGTPILFMKKKDGGLHLCVDYCALNQITKKSHSPLPLINKLLDRLCRATIYTKINLCDGYYNI
jgi:hypothetical protein